MQTTIDYIHPHYYANWLEGWGYVCQSGSQSIFNELKFKICEFGARFIINNMVKTRQMHSGSEYTNSSPYKYNRKHNHDDVLDELIEDMS